MNRWGNQTTSQKRGPILVDVALKMAASQVESLCAVAPLDEEVITGGIFGILFSTMQWIVEVSDADPNDLHKCKWGLYRKYRSDIERNTERYSGADFALVVSDDDQLVRIAIFQAKRAFAVDEKNQGGPIAIDVHQRPKSADARGLRETQMLRMARIGARLECWATNNAPPPKTLRKAPPIHDMGWIYYLAYLRQSATCVPLKELGKEYKIECTSTVRANLVELEDNSRKLTRSLNSVFDCAFQLNDPGWLTVSMDAVSAELPALANLMPLAVVDQEGVLTRRLEEQLKLSRHNDQQVDRKSFSEHFAALKSDLERRRASKPG